MHDHTNITVEHVARVEGHGNIVVNVRSGKVEEVRLEIVESPRFFESMLVGQDADAAPELTARICGICSVGHTTASIKAVEAALKIEPSEQTLLLRRIILAAEILQSHVLHVYFLVAPDVFAAPSVIPLAEKYPEIVKRALRLKKFANRIMTIIGGRHIHPVAMKVGGFSKIPEESEVLEILDLIETATVDVDETVNLFGEIHFPDFRRPSEYIALRKNGSYSFYEGNISSTANQDVDPVRYLDVIRESVKQHSTAKHVHLQAGRDCAFSVGALARYNINGRETLRPRAARAADALNLEQMKDNPFANNFAQVVECVHLVEDIQDLVSELLARGLKDERPPAVGSGHAHGRTRSHGPTRSGVGAVEVPRGTLYHEYEIDGHGHIVRANCIIPTGQNLARMEQDLREMVPGILDLPEDEIRLRCEMLVRAYDPCISCSTHMLDVKFRK